MTWTIDQYQCHNLYAQTQQGQVHIWIEPRPPYCDRGHWIGKVEGISSIDEADKFPRYYMDLARAKLEMEEWLKWRLHREFKHEPTI